MQKLRNDGSSGLVTIPKQFLERDDVLDDGDVPEEQRVNVDRLGRRAYLVRVTDDGSLPELHELEVVRRVAAERMLSEDAFGRTQRAD